MAPSLALAIAARGCKHCSSGTPLPSMISSANIPSSPPLLSVVSYNVLAPAYVRPYDKRTGVIQPFAAFEWISEEDSDEVLNAEKRGPRLLDLLKSSRADAICLQELQLERGGEKDGPAEYVLPRWIRPLVDGGGYAAFLPPQKELRQVADRNVRILNLDAAVTCAILYRTDRLAPAGESAQQGVEGKSNKRDDDTNTSVSLYLKGICSSELGGIGPTVVTSLHLDATDEAKRVGQIARCFRRARVLAAREAYESLPPMVIAGDMNSELFRGSCLKAFLQNSGEDNASELPTEEEFKRACALALFLPPGTAPTEDQMNEWKELHANAKKISYDNCARLSRVETGPTHAALDREQSGKSPQMRQWCLDHIMYTSQMFSPVSVWSTLEDDQETATVTGLPNRRCPSDHIPLGVVLAMLPPPSIPDQHQDALMLTLTQSAQRQFEKYENLQSELDEQLAEIEARCSETNMDATTKQAKKRKPPQAVVDFMRQRRARLKDMKAQHKNERQALVDALSDLERLAVQHRFGCTASEWVEKGKK